MVQPNDEEQEVKPTRFLQLRHCKACEPCSVPPSASVLLAYGICIQVTFLSEGTGGSCGHLWRRLLAACARRWLRYPRYKFNNSSSGSAVFRRVGECLRPLTSSTRMMRPLPASAGHLLEYWLQLFVLTSRPVAPGRRFSHWIPTEAAARKCLERYPSALRTQASLPFLCPNIKCQVL
jgi:hypothetical protein